MCTAAANTHITLRNDSSINKNSAISFGGAIYGAPVLKGIPLSITVESSSIYDNEAANGAGIAIYNQFDKKDATITIKSGGKLYGNKKQQMVMVVVFTAKNTTITIGENTTNSVLMKRNLLQIITVLLSATTKQASAVVFMDLTQILYSPKTMHCITMLHKRPVMIYSHLALIV